jgi:hypothetical protein
MFYFPVNRNVFLTCSIFPSAEMSSLHVLFFRQQMCLAGEQCNLIVIDENQWAVCEPSVPEETGFNLTPSEEGIISPYDNEGVPVTEMPPQRPYDDDSLL